MTDICSSHLRLVSLLSSWYSPALLNRERRAVSSCSASVQRAPVAAWQKITSRRSCKDVSIVEGGQKKQTKQKQRKKRKQQHANKGLIGNNELQCITFSVTRCLISVMDEPLCKLPAQLSCNCRSSYLPPISRKIKNRSYLIFINSCSFILSMNRFFALTCTFEQSQKKLVLPICRCKKKAK